MGISTTPTIVSTRKNLGATLHGPLPTVDRFGRADQAYKFDGIDDFLEIPNDAMLNLQKFTLVLTFKILAVPPGPDYATKMTLLAKGRYPGNYDITLGCFRGSNLPLVSYSHQSSLSNFSTTCWNKRLELNKYYQVAVAYADHNVSIAINGVLGLQEGNLPEPLSNAESMLVGKSLNPDAPQFFNGVIDDVRLYDWALTLDELIRLYKSDAL